MDKICNNSIITKNIGYGYFGTTYMVKYNGKKYAMKIQKILQSQLKPSTEHMIWREIYFAKVMSKYPNQFEKIYCYQITTNCKNIRTGNKELNSSQYCIRIIFDLKEGVLKDLMKKVTLSEKHIYSFISQVIYAIYLMKKHNFIHTDLHNKNIAYVKTSKKQIRLNDIDVNTFGYIYSIIDYGCVLHPKFKNVWETNKRQLLNDTLDMKWIMFLLLYNYYEIIDANKKYTKRITVVYSGIRSSEEYKKLKKKYKLTTKNDDDILLFTIIYPELSLQYKGLKNIPNIHIHRLVSLKDHIFIWKNRRNLLKLVKYFVNKANS